jgi:hypothetical protein
LRRLPILKPHRYNVARTNDVHDLSTRVKDVRD